MRSEHERVRALLTDTVTLLCKNGLMFNTQLKIEGVIGITVDADVFVVHINELFGDSMRCESSGGDDLSTQRTEKPELRQFAGSQGSGHVAGSSICSAADLSQTSSQARLKAKQKVRFPMPKQVKMEGGGGESRGDCGGLTSRSTANLTITDEDQVGGKKLNIKQEYAEYRDILQPPSSSNLEEDLVFVDSDGGRESFEADGLNLGGEYQDEFEKYDEYGGREEDRDGQWDLEGAEASTSSWEQYGLSRGDGSSSANSVSCCRVSSGGGEYTVCEFLKSCDVLMNSNILFDV